MSGFCARFWGPNPSARRDASFPSELSARWNAVDDWVREGTEYAAVTISGDGYRLPPASNGLRDVVGTDGTAADTTDVIGT
ncbi:hypothetical protein [Halovivax ruber]|uniref:hypothetical protein n=1 Tax=Halovivax ruber TaxID=387341 RepID=UPI0011E509F9|nr:hypothetical protein [Halovivax ruber]